MFGPLPAGEDISRCWNCGEAVLLLDESFFAALSKFLKYWYRHDRTLLARVKWEIPDPSPLKLEGVLSWLNKPWEKTPMPRGRPLETEMYLFFAIAIEALAAPRFVPEVNEEGQPIFGRREPLLSLADAIDVLRGNYPEDGTTISTPSRHLRRFGGLTSDTLRQIHEEFRTTALERFGVAPSLETREVQRLMRWYKRWPEATYRIQGNKVRKRRVERTNKAL